MTLATITAAVMMLGITLYACTGIADYGAGFWDLTAGGREPGRRPRQLIDAAITPVWEANHVWLIFTLVLCWTAFGPAFASIMTTLFIPLAAAAFGIVLRAASFAMSKDAARARARHIAGWLFGVGSILTPFCFGVVVGAIITGRVPVGNAAGNELSSWWNFTSIVVGLLVVALGAFVAAVYLIAEANKRGIAELPGYFRRRAIAAGAAALVLGVIALVTLLAEQRQMFDRVVSRSWPLIVLGLVALAAVFWLAARGTVRGVRLVAGVGVAALVWAWAVAQYPYLLPFSLTIEAGAAPSVTLGWILGWFVVSLLLVVPALILLFVLDQRADLAEDPTTSRPTGDFDAAASPIPSSRSADLGTGG